MSSTKSSKGSTEVKSRAKVVLSSLEKLGISSNPDREQTRYLCHKLLQLVNNQEATKKDVTSKAGLDIILSTLESCNDQGACLALVSTLAQLANEGNTAMKRLISHDATRVLLHTLSYLGADLDWRLMSAIITLLAKLGQKDRRFALRARLTGSLPMLLTAVRSSHNHHSHLRMLPAALGVLKLCVNNSSSNASLLGRAGAVNVLFKVATSLTRKHPIPLKTSLAALNLLIRHSKANASRAVALSITPHMLSMHREYHKVDFRANRHVAVRKSLLNIVKNTAVLKSGRRSFIEAGGIEVLYASCKDYLAVSGSATNKSVESLLSVATLILRRCQKKCRLPVTNSHCTFRFRLPGRRRSESTSSTECFDDESEDDDAFDDDEEEGNLSHTPQEQEDAEDTAPCKRRDSTYSISKLSQASDKETGAFPKQRTHEDLKMYEKYFPELQEFPLTPDAANWIDMDSSHRPHSSGEVGKPTIVKQRQFGHYSDPNLSALGTLLPLLNNSDNCNPWELPCDVTNVSTALQTLGVADRQKMAQRETSSYHQNTNSSSASYVAKQPTSLRNGQQHQQVNMSCGDERLARPLPTMAWEKNQTDVQKQVNLPHISNGFQREDYELERFQDGLNAEHAELIRNICQLATETVSVKEDRNRLSLADQWGNLPPSKPEPQANKRNVQRLIKSKVLEDVARFLNPEQLINRAVYPEPQQHQNHQQHSTLNTEFTNGRIYKCDVRAPSNGYPETHVTIPTGLEPVPKHKDALEVESTSTTVSDDTWPAAIGRSVEGVEKLPHLTNGDAPEEQEVKEEWETAEENSSPSLKFDSKFESGNLRTAVRVREFEYDLVLNSDCNCTNHHQWFYFQVSRMLPNQAYRFNIVNCEKKGSVFNEGMQPVMYSMIEANNGRPCWRRAGKETCYYRNHFLRHSVSAGGTRNRTYFTLTFTVTFQYENDVCYFAYHYPYTYTSLQMDLRNLLQRVDESTMFVRRQNFCHTLSGNPLPLLTITSQPRSGEFTTHRQAVEELRSRPYIFLTARVHPGESNASWTMRGTLKLLLTPPPGEDAGLDEGTGSTLAAVADELRRSYIFKIVPMLNPDGVINGHHRCSLSGDDLNRTWNDPHPQLFPTIFHTKGLLQYLYSIHKSPLVYCDYHGHSRKMNVFLYGCSHKDSIASGEASTVLDGPDDSGCKALPRLLNHFAPTFSMKNCNFVVEKAKASTARVVVWREMGVARSYTMESTYCGCDQGMLRGKQLSTKDLEQMGSKFCEVLLHLKARNKTRGLPVFDIDDDGICRHENNEDGIKNPGQIPGCPANSDAELTPDEDDLSPVDTSYFLPGFEDDPSYNHASGFNYSNDEPSSSKTDLAFWRYDPKDPTLTASNPRANPKVSDPVRISMTSGDPVTCKHRTELPVITAKISPDTGRLICYEYSRPEPEEVTIATAPRPFESGLVLRRDLGVCKPAEMPSQITVTSLVASAARAEGKTARSRRRSLKRGQS
uniref:tubulin-glutamate carboxypeptidase n=1 Tax=Phallusia mammillata TaxID=59560 RepID=A0A6F9D6K9_9ASCI|nr:cytosolic carboxypeptidase 1-like [Phallusia mammillata]